MRLFYDHLLLDLHSVYAEIEHLEINVKDKRELIKIIDSTTHHTVVDTILHNLHRDHHEKFLQKLSHSPHDPRNLEWLKGYVTDIENKIITAIKELSAQLRASISPESQADK